VKKTNAFHKMRMSALVAAVEPYKMSSPFLSRSLLWFRLFVDRLKTRVWGLGVHCLFYHPARSPVNPKKIRKKLMRKVVQHHLGRIVKAVVALKVVLGVSMDNSPWRFLDIINPTVPMNIYPRVSFYALP
jgi:hypothetical protein